MLIIKVRSNESIDRALRRYKKKFKNTGILSEVRQRSYYVKPSEKRRLQVEKARYKQKLFEMYGD